MSTTTRRWTGALLLFLSVLGCGLVVRTGYWAQVPGAPPPTRSAGLSVYSNLIYKIDIPSWQMAVILGIGAIGLLLVVLPKKRRPPD